MVFTRKAFKVYGRAESAYRKTDDELAALEKKISHAIPEKGFEQ